MDQSDAPDSFLTVAEVAGILKLNQQTVRNWIDQGSLPALRVGRRGRIRRSDFERVLAEGATGRSGGSGNSSDSTSSVGAGAHASGDTASSGAATATGPTHQRSGPTAEDFWGGEAVGLAPAMHDPTAGNGSPA